MLLDKNIAIANKNKKRLSGFTLVEVLLYLSITGIILLSISYFLSVLLEARIKSRTIAEVEQSGTQAMQIIQQTIRNSTGVNAPAMGASASSCSLESFEAVKNPVVFDLSSGFIRIKEGSSEAINLTSGRLDASGLSFGNLSQAGESGLIRVQFTLTHKNPSGRNEYNYSRTFYGSAGIRH